MKQGKKVTRIMHETSKKYILIFLICFFFLRAGWATEITAGINFGYRQLDDPGLKEIYGNGYVYSPYLKFTPFKIFSLQASYEGGYKKDSKVGIYNEDSNLEIYGFEISGILHYRIQWFAPYFKFGYGYYSYKQDITSDYVRLKVDHHSSTVSLGAGINIYLYKGLFLSSEIKYVPMKVSPFDIQVDLGGLRYLFGVGFEFGL